MIAAKLVNKQRIVQTQCLIHKPAPTFGRSAGKQEIIVNKNDRRNTAKKFFSIVYCFSMKTNFLVTVHPGDRKSAFRLFGNMIFSMNSHFFFSGTHHVPILARTKRGSITQEIERLKKVGFSLTIFSNQINIMSIKVHLGIDQITKTIELNGLKTQDLFRLHWHYNVKIC